MKRLLWIGDPYFANSLPECGWEQVEVRHPAGEGPLGWNQLVEMAAFDPDVLVVAARDAVPHVLGMENFPCLTVFYSVSDSNDAWQSAYAQGFDACMVSRFDHLPRFCGPYLQKENVWWSPPFARETRGSRQQPQIWDYLFIGEDDAEKGFWTNVAARLPDFMTEKCDFRAFYPKARVLLNQAAGNSLDFKVFEAMSLGACLVTQRVDDGLGKLFVDGEHLVVYAPQDAGDAAYRLEFLLKRPDLCAYIAKTAQEEINARHMAKHRAEAFTDHLCDIYINGVDATIDARRARAAEIRQNVLSDLYLSLPQNDPEMKAACEAAARGEF